jgi:hypothetical protein
LVAVTHEQEFSMPEMLSVSEASRLLGANPRDVSDLLYRRELRDDLCPVVAGRRLIPRAYVEQIRRALRLHGRRVLASPTSGKEAVDAR